MTFGKKGAATLSDYGAYSSGAATRIAADNDIKNMAGYDTDPTRTSDYVILSNWQDGLLGIFLGSIGVSMMAAFLPEIQYGPVEAWPALMGGLCALGGALLMINAVTKKPKLIVDSTGLHAPHLFGTASISWTDLDKFEVWTVNYNKMIFAYGSEKSMLMAKNKLTLPKKAIKSRNFEFAQCLAKYRPDLFEYMPVLMKAAGAKKLIPVLQEQFGGI